jgi:hypothetical protein
VAKLAEREEEENGNGGSAPGGGPVESSTPDSAEPGDDEGPSS